MPRGIYPLTLEDCQRRAEQFRVLNKARTGKPLSEEHRHKISLGLLGNQNTLGHKLSEAHKQAVGQAQKGKPKSPRTPEQLENMRKAALNMSQEAKDKISKTLREIWQDPTYKAEALKNQLKGRYYYPNRLETKVLEAINKHHLPYRYTGDGGFIIHGICPDFINTNNQKIVIEVFGNYFHSPEVLGNEWRRTELGRIMVYNSFGFRCLILWEDDIWSATSEEIAKQIRNFERRK